MVPVYAWLTYEKQGLFKTELVIVKNHWNLPFQILMQQSADTVKRLSMELGGNGPCIIFNSADVNRAAHGAFLGKFRNGGQVCWNFFESRFPPLKNIKNIKFLPTFR